MHHGRVCRRRLRAHLLRRCAAGGVRFRAGELVRLEPNQAGETAALALADGSIVRTRCAPLPCSWSDPDGDGGVLLSLASLHVITTASEYNFI